MAPIGTLLIFSQDYSQSADGNIQLVLFCELLYAIIGTIFGRATARQQQKKFGKAQKV